MRIIKRSLGYWIKAMLISAALTLTVALALVINQELRTSALQARFFADLASQAKFSVGPGPSPSIRFPTGGPYDERLGYTGLQSFVDVLRAKNFDVVQQARVSPRMAELSDAGFFAPYIEKTQIGLSIFDCRKHALFEERYPQRVYRDLDEVPPILVASLLFIENRELLDPRYPTRDPAVEWDRLAKAVLDKTLYIFSREGKVPGGSTLATQIEKYRHSPEGRTTSIKDKFRQMVSAALRAYQQGEDTNGVRRQIVLTYLNTMPLSAKTGYGEVNGLGDGLWAWYGRDFSEVGRLLKNDAAQADNLTELARAYKQALSLLIAQRRPSYYFEGNQDDLEELTDSYLRLLANVGVITPKLRDAALATVLMRRDSPAVAPPISFVTRKAANAVRTQLAGLLGGTRFYNLDRLDLSVNSTLDAQVQASVTGVLRDLRDPAKAAAAGLHATQLLERGDPAKVIYSFTLYERGDDANYLRVQTDNFDQPLSINEGTKLDLGSTAKLRTLVTYLEIIADLHQRFHMLDASQLRAIKVDGRDDLTRWARDYFLAERDRSMSAMLDAALERRYSANPNEEFFTGGGVHRFENFKREDNGKIMSVRDGLRNSVNLVFIRLIRDVARHYMFQTPGSSAKLLEDADDPRRAEYLARFADREGRVFIQRFYQKYQGKTPNQMEELLLGSVVPSARRLAAVFRTIAPQASFDEFVTYLKDRLPAAANLNDKKLAKVYEQHAPERMSLTDRGFVAGVHPLELWLVGYLRAHPDAGQARAVEASTKERQAVYQWLFSAHRKHVQDKRILNMLEVEGFLEIHKRWKRLGYPFDALVPSYATALGASADRPAALAELMGIIVNEGVRKPSVRIEALHFAAETPYETLLQFRPPKAERVLPRELAQAVSAALRLVVEEGTARRANKAFIRADGTVVPLGGKTGTGDHRFDTIDAHGQRIESRVVNRSATFVFNIGGRYFGSITAYVPGAQAARYSFTSALPVQLLKVLAPRLVPLVGSIDGGCA